MLSATDVGIKQVLSWHIRPPMPLRAALRLLATASAEAFLSASTCPREGRSNPASDASAGTSAPAEALSPGPCLQDGDCALTRMPPDGCCETCTPAAVLRTALAQRELSCAEARSRCPALSCAPQRFMTVAVCREGKCSAERADNR